MKRARDGEDSQGDDVPTSTYLSGSFKNSSCFMGTFKSIKQTKEAKKKGSGEATDICQYMFHGKSC